MFDLSKYTNLTVRAAGIIRKAKLNIDAGDLISETFLLFGDLPEDDFSKEMYGVAFNNLKTNGYNKNEKKNYEDRVCRRCNDVKPSGMFRTWYLRGYLIFDSYCRPCKNELINEHKRRKKI